MLVALTFHRPAVVSASLRMVQIAQVRATSEAVCLICRLHPTDRFADGAPDVLLCYTSASGTLSTCGHLDARACVPLQNCCPSLAPQAGQWVRSRNTSAAAEPTPVRLGWLPEPAGKNDSGADVPRARLLSNKQDEPVSGGSGHAAAADALQHESAAEEASSAGQESGQESAPADVSEQQGAQPAATQQEPSVSDEAQAQQQTAGAGGQEAASADPGQATAEQQDQGSSTPASVQEHAPAQDAVPAQLDAAEATAEVDAPAQQAELGAQPVTKDQDSLAVDSAPAQQQPQPAAAEQEQAPATQSGDAATEQQPNAAEQDAQPSAQTVSAAGTPEATDPSQQAAAHQPGVWSSYRALPNVHEAHPIECGPLRMHPLLLPPCVHRV